MSPAPYAGSSMPLAALVYKSRATVNFDARSLNELVSRAQARNAEEGLTGAVYYESGRFLQWLEGPADRLDHVSASISQDKRHTDIEIVSYGFVPARMYSSWTMQLLTQKPARRMTQTPNRFDGEMVPTVAARELAAGADRAADAFLACVPPTAASAVAQCEKIAAAYLPLWQAELCNSVDITIGLTHLLRLFRRRTASIDPGYRATPSQFLVAAAPDEPHFIGAALAAELLREKGFHVDLLLPRTAQDIIQCITESQADAVVLATSPVFSRAERANDFSRLATAIRKAHADCNPRVTLYGQAPTAVCGEAIDHVTACASDIDPDQSTSADASLYPDAARNLLH